MIGYLPSNLLLEYANGAKPLLAYLSTREHNEDYVLRLNPYMYG